MLNNLKLKLILPLLVLIFALSAGYVNHRATWFVQDAHFTKLATSFIKNDLFLNPINLPNGDFVDYFGKQYLFFGPMPSIILILPVLIFGPNFPQFSLSLASILITFLSIFYLSKKLGFSKIDSVWLANFFVFGTVFYFVALVNISAYVVQALGTTFVVLALTEYFTKKRPIVIGALVAAAGTTRITLFAALLFFLLEFLKTESKTNLRKNLLLLLIPVVVSVAFLGIYNQRRFHSFFETGYTKNVSVLDKNYYNYTLGWFNPIHIPTNLYSLLLMGPEPQQKDNVQFVLEFPYLKANGFGLAIWFTSPLFLYLIFAKRKPYTTSATLTIAALALPSLFYMGIGASQFGYRYSLDFLPFLFLILLTAFKNVLTGRAKLIITTGIVIDCFYMLSIWNTYALLNFWEYLN